MSFLIEFLRFLKKFSEQIFMPLTLGGGVRTLKCFENLFAIIRSFITKR